MASADVCVDPAFTGTPDETERAWRTVLVGGLRQGGRRLLRPRRDAARRHRHERPLRDVRRDRRATRTPRRAASTAPARAASRVRRPTASTRRSCGSSTIPARPARMRAARVGSPLGETWSRPVIGRIKVIDSASPTADAGGFDDRYVAIFGGGFDPSFTAGRRRGDQARHRRRDPGPRVLRRGRRDGRDPLQDAERRERRRRHRGLRSDARGALGRGLQRRRLSRRGLHRRRQRPDVAHRPDAGCFVDADAGRDRERPAPRLRAVPALRRLRSVRHGSAPARSRSSSSRASSSSAAPALRRSSGSRSARATARSSPARTSQAQDFFYVVDSGQTTKTFVKTDLHDLTPPSGSACAVPYTGDPARMPSMASDSTTAPRTRRRRRPPSRRRVTSPS